MTDQFLTKERYNEILKMLQSQDEETKKLAFRLLKRVDQITNIGYLLLLRKKGYVTPIIWRNSFPDLAVFIERVVERDSESILSYMDILNALVKANVNLDQIEIVLEELLNNIHERLLQSGRSSIKSLTINIEYHE